MRGISINSICPCCLICPYINLTIMCYRYMPLLTVIQEIHFKLRTRIRVNRDAMLKSDTQLCPRIKKKLDLLITELGNWRASWNDSTRYSVKQGTRVVTVDYVERVMHRSLYGEATHRKIIVQPKLRMQFLMKKLKSEMLANLLKNNSECCS